VSSASQRATAPPLGRGALCVEPPSAPGGIGPYAGSTSGNEDGINGLPASNADVLPGYLEHPDRIDELGKRADVVEATIHAVWGINAPLGRNFPCVLPGHKGHASMYCDRQSGVWKVRCWCHDEWWTLAEARAALGYRRGRHLGNPERAVWYRRLWYDAALIEAVPVLLGPLPDDATEAAERVWTGFARLVGLRWLTHQGQPVPYTRAFAAAWSDVSPGTADKAINAALSSGLFRQVAERRLGARRLRLFLPGSHLAMVGDHDA
jgi:hypothetical protein